MEEGVTSDIIFLQQFLLDIFGKIIVGGTCVGIFSCATRAWWRESVGFEYAVSSTPGVERAVDVEQTVALDHLVSYETPVGFRRTCLVHRRSVAVQRRYRAIFQQIAPPKVFLPVNSRPERI